MLGSPAVVVAQVSLQVVLVAAGPNGCHLHGRLAEDAPPSGCAPRGSKHLQLLHAPACCFSGLQVGVLLHAAAQDFDP